MKLNEGETNLTSEGEELQTDARNISSGLLSDVGQTKACKWKARRRPFHGSSSTHGHEDG